MARVDRLVGPSSADVAKELTVLIQQGKISTVTNKPHQWSDWKASLCGLVNTVDVWGSSRSSTYAHSVTSRETFRRMGPLRLRMALRVALRRLTRWQPTRSRRPQKEGGLAVPRASLSGYSNGASDERTMYVSEAETADVLEEQEQMAGLEIAASAESDIAEDQEAESSVGTSSSTSGSSPDKSGTSSMTGPQLPVPETDSHSSKDLPPSQESSTAPTTDGSGQETTSDQPSQPDSSAASAPRAQATRGQGTRSKKASP